MKAVPQLKDFGIDRVYGFLPVNPPLILRLNSYYDPWENIVDNLPSYLEKGTLRSVVDQMPLLECKHLKGDRAWQRAYTVLAFLANGYIWNDLKSTSQDLPQQVAIPLLEVAENLGVSPIVSYSSVDLYNFYLVDPLKQSDMDNLRIYQTFTGTRDEEWFLRNSLAIESKSGEALSCIMNALEALSNIDNVRLSQELLFLAEVIHQMTLILHRMNEKDSEGRPLNDPLVFFNKVRPYMSGWSNHKDLPEGVTFHTKNGPLKLMLAGASAGQSPIMHCLDVALDIKHYITKKAGTREGMEHKLTYIYEMRKYMSKNNKNFIEALENAPSIRSYVLELEKRNPQDQCVSSYNQCVANLQKFRDFHIQLVTRYIVLPNSSMIGSEEDVSVKGTGGTG